MGTIRHHRSGRGNLGDHRVVRSSASTVVKLVWIVCAVLFSIITAVVWAVWGRKEFGGQKAVI